MSLNPFTHTEFNLNFDVASYLKAAMAVAHSRNVIIALLPPDRRFWLGGWFIGRRWALTHNI